MKLPTKYTQLAHDKVWELVNPVCPEWYDTPPILQDINAMDVSPNDKLMVTGSQDKTAKVLQNLL